MQGVPNPIPDPVGVKFPEIPQLSMAPQFGPGSGSGEQFPMMQAPSPPLEVQQEEVVGVKLGGIKSGHIQAIPIPVCQDPGLQRGISVVLQGGPQGGSREFVVEFFAFW